MCFEIANICRNAKTWHEALTQCKFIMDKNAFQQDTYRPHITVQQGGAPPRTETPPVNRQV